MADPRAAGVGDGLVMLCVLCVCAEPFSATLGQRAAWFSTSQKKLLATPLISHSSQAATIPVSAPVFLRSRRARAFGLDKGG